MLKRPSYALLSLSATIAIAACGSDEPPGAAPAARPPGGPTVVASTAWTGALARAAGARKVTLIAPFNVQHPSDYEPKPSDLVAVANADFVVYARYDAFAEQLARATGSDAKLQALAPENSPQKVRADVMTLAERFRTRRTARAWIKTFDAEYRRLSAQTKAKLAGRTAVAQVFNTPWAAFAGIELLGTYGPKPTTPGQLLGLRSKRAQLLLENANLPQGQALEGDGMTKVSLLNYPTGLDLLEVFRANARALQAAAA